MASLLALSAARCLAHDFSITEASLFWRSDRSFSVDMIVDVDALLLGVGSGHDPAALEQRIASMSTEQREVALARLVDTFERRVRVRFDGHPAPFAVTFPDRVEGLLDPSRPSYYGVRARLTGFAPPAARTLTFFASRAFRSVHLTVYRFGNERVWQRVLLAGEESPPLSLDATAEASVPADAEGHASRAEHESGWRAAGRFLWLGCTHIVPFGLDHILFVLALFLLSSNWRPLLYQVTAFTLAHSVTLALATLHVVTMSPAIVEPLIALSIVAVALENLWHEKLVAWRVVVVFAFGLLHGLGFASMLARLGLPERGLVPALLSFNVGVEVGQLVVVGLAALATAALRERTWYRRRVVLPSSSAIALVALYWTTIRALRLLP